MDIQAVCDTPGLDGRTVGVFHFVINLMFPDYTTVTEHVLLIL